MPPWNNIAPASTDPLLYRKQVAKMVVERTGFSRDESIDIRRKVSRYYDQWRGFIRGRAQAFRNTVHLPLLFSGIEAGIAIKHGLLTGAKPYVEFIPGGPEDTKSARRVTGLVQQQFEDDDLDTKLELIMRMGDITGTAPFQWSWKHVVNTRPQRVPNMMPPSPLQQSLFEVITTNVTDFDGPWIDPVDLLDWFPAPGHSRIKEMPWCVRRYWMDLDEILKLVQDGLFDAEAFDEVQETQLTEIATAEFEDRRGTPGTLRWSPAMTGRYDKYSKPVEVLEMHGTIPSEMVPGDGFRNRLITVANGLAVLRNVPNPIWSGGLPFGVYSPVRDPFSIYGVGKVEPNDKLQATASRLASQQLDVMDLVIDPAFAYNQLANVRTDKLFAKPGALYGGDGPPSEWLMPVSPNLQGLELGMQQIQVVWNWMQHGTGVSEEAIGFSGEAGSDRQTAREFLGKMENVQRRMVREALVAASDVLPPLAEAFRAMDSQFLPVPTLIRMLGQSAIIDPVTGQPIPPDQSIGLEDIVLRYDMRPASATSLIGRSAKQQNDVLLLQAIGASPMAMVINWYTFARQMLLDFEKTNVDELVMPLDPRLVQMAQMMSQMPKQGAGPGGTGGQGGANPDSTVAGTPGGQNVDILDQMVRPESSLQRNI